MSLGIQALRFKREIPKHRNDPKCYTKRFPGTTGVGKNKFESIRINRVMSEDVAVKNFDLNAE